MKRSFDSEGGVLVLHPGLQHSHQLAWACYEAGILRRFISGVPIIGPNEKPPIWMPRGYAARLKATTIPEEKRENPLLFYAMSRAVTRLPYRFREDNYHRIFHMFDRWASAKVLELRPNTVVAFENSANETFLAAKKIGAKCVLDLPSLEQGTAATLLGTAPTPYLPEINRRKKNEIRLADVILTCSELATESYVNAGYSRSRFHSILLGAAANGVTRSRQSKQAAAGPVFIFAGMLSYRKSVDIILDIFAEFNRIDVNAQLELIGPTADIDIDSYIRRNKNIRYIESLPQASLFQKLADADCLILASRFDSFGMVAAEALSCGTPVILSSTAGAAEIVRRFPGCGWIVEPTRSAIQDCILQRIRDLPGLEAARAGALVAAQSFTWASYRQAVSKVISTVT